MGTIQACCCESGDVKDVKMTLGMMLGTDERDAGNSGIVNASKWSQDADVNIASKPELPVQPVLPLQPGATRQGIPPPSLSLVNKGAVARKYCPDSPAIDSVVPALAAKPPADEDRVRWVVPGEEQALAESCKFEFMCNGETKVIDFSKSDDELGLDFERKLPLVVMGLAPGGQAERCGVQVGWELVSVDGRPVKNMAFQGALAFIRQKCAEPVSPVCDSDSHCAQPVLVCEDCEIPEEPQQDGVMPVMKSFQRGNWGDRVYTQEAYRQPIWQAKAPAMQPLSTSKLELTFDSRGQPQTVAFTRSPLGLIFDENSENPLAVARILPGTEAEMNEVEPGWQLIQVEEQPVSNEDYRDVMALLSSLSAELNQSE